MVAVTIVFLVAACFGLAGAFAGYNFGFDDGWETAEACFKEEVNNVSGNY